jgi:hypothetical protein
MPDRRKFNIPKETLHQLYVVEWKTPAQIGSMYGVTGGTITYWLGVYGIPNHKTRIQGLDKANLERLYVNLKWSTIKIAEHVGAKTDETVRKALMRHGIPLRTKSEAGKVKVFTPEHMAKLRASGAAVNKGQLGAAHPAWKGGRWLDSDGYVIVNVMGRRWKEHRYVIGQQLGRELLPWEEVNHINGIRTDNRLENLEVIPSEHKYKDWRRRNSVRP